MLKPLLPVQSKTVTFQNTQKGPLMSIKKNYVI